MQAKSVFHQIKSSISAKFFTLFFILLIIPLMIVTQLFVTRLHSILKEKERASTYENITFAENELSHIFSDMESMVVSLLLNYNVTDILANPASMPSYEWYYDYKTINSLLDLLNSSTGYKYNVTIISRDGNMYYSGGLYNAVLTPDSPLLSHIREANGAPAIFNRSLYGFDNQPVITYGRAIYKQEKFHGTILVEIPVSYLDELLSPFEDNSAQVYVINQDSRIIYSSMPVEQSTIPQALNEALASDASSVYLDSQEYLLQQRPMEQNKLTVAVLVDIKSVFRESSQAVFFFILAFILIIGTAVIGMFVLIRFFTRDILSLNAAVSRFGENVGTDIQLKIRSSDEVGQLTQGVISMSHRINHLLCQIREAERNKRILEFNALQSQINPHMIYNTLNTITYLAELQNISNIQEISSSFAHLLRSLSNQGEYISVAMELQYLRAFISIKKYNLLCQIDCDFQVDPLAENCRILKLILQPIVENAIIHGFSNRIEGGLLTISIKRREEMLYIDISDNGNGMEEATIQQILSGKDNNKNTFLRVGIRSIIDRLTLQYEEQTSFSIVSAPNCGTTVHITFPALEMPDNMKNELTDTERN